MTLDLRAIPRVMRTPMVTTNALVADGVPPYCSCGVVGGRGTHAAILSTRPAAPPSCGGAGRNMSLPCAVNEAPPAGRCRRQVRKACAPPKEKDA